MPFALDNQAEYAKAEADIVSYAQGLGLHYDFDTLQLQKPKITEADMLSREEKEKVMEWLDNFLLSGEKKITLFFKYTEHLLEFAKKYDAMIINGNTPISKRFAMVNEYNTGTKQVLCGNIQACGVGLGYNRMSQLHVHRY